MIGAASVKWLMSADIKYQYPVTEKDSRTRSLAHSSWTSHGQESKGGKQGAGTTQERIYGTLSKHVTFELGFYNLVVDTENLFFIVDKLRF